MFADTTDYMMKILTLLLPVILFISCQSSVNNADDVIQKHILFIGGEQPWKKIKTIVSAGEYDYGSMKFPFTSYAKAPNLYKFVVPLNGKYYAQAFDGVKGWKIDAFKDETTPTPLTGKAALAMANEADVELGNVFIGYHDEGHSALLEGKDTIEHRACYKIKFTRKNGDVERYFFDEKSFELVMKQAVSKNAEMGGSLLNIYYYDYREVDGIKFSFKSISKIEAQSILTVTVDNVVLNSDIEDSEFSTLK
jgi:hypothetical protein